MTAQKQRLKLRKEAPIIIATVHGLIRIIRPDEPKGVHDLIIEHPSDLKAVRSEGIDVEHPLFTYKGGVFSVKKGPVYLDENGLNIPQGYVLKEPEMVVDDVQGIEVTTPEGEREP